MMPNQELKPCLSSSTTDLHLLLEGVDHMRLWVLTLGRPHDDDLEVLRKTGQIPAETGSIMMEADDMLAEAVLLAFDQANVDVWMEASD